MNSLMIKSILFSILFGEAICYAEIEVIDEGLYDRASVQHIENGSTWYQSDGLETKIELRSVDGDGSKIEVKFSRPTEFLIRGLKIEPKSFSRDSIPKYRPFLYPGTGHPLASGSVSYQWPLKIDNYKIHFSPFVKNFEYAGGGGEQPFRLLWRGDLNQDKIEDFLIDTSMKKGRIQEVLFLSNKLNDKDGTYKVIPLIPPHQQER